MAKKSTDAVSFLLLSGQIKRTIRTGWKLRGIPNPESVSDHMYRMSLMAFLLPKINCTESSTPALDRDRVMKMAIVHDLAEAIVGDITPYCGVSKEEKLKRETEGMAQLCSHLSPDVIEEIMDLWNEYNEQITAEAKMTKDFDRFDMILQAYEYEQEFNKPKAHEDFFDSTEGKFTSDLVSSWTVDLLKRRDAGDSKSDG